MVCYEGGVLLQFTNNAEAIREIPAQSGAWPTQHKTTRPLRSQPNFRIPGQLTNLRGTKKDRGPDIEVIALNRVAEGGAEL